MNKSNWRNEYVDKCWQRLTLSNLVKKAYNITSDDEVLHILLAELDNFIINSTVGVKD